MRYGERCRDVEMKTRVWDGWAEQWKEEGWSSDTVLCRGRVSKGQARSCSKLRPNALPDVATGSGGQ